VRRRDARQCISTNNGNYPATGEQAIVLLILKY